MAACGRRCAVADRTSPPSRPRPAWRSRPMSLATLPVALAPAMLTSIAAGLASAIDPDDYGFALDDDRGYALLLRTDAYEAWLIAWAPGGSLDLHDHGGSTGE